MPLLKKSSSPSFDSSAEKAGPSRELICGDSPLKFPNTFSIFCTTNFKTFTYQLGEEQKQPLYAVTHHINFSKKKPKIVLHSGPDGKSSPVASARCDSNWKLDTQITIPGPKGPITEPLKSRCMSKHATYSFAVRVADGPESYPEQFEWRCTRGAEVGELEGRNWGGWKLVRVGGERPPRQGGGRKSRERGETSDGKEVVAVMGDKLGWRKHGTFQFLGSGATGELGESWTMMTVMSALRIWQIQWEMASASAVAASS